MGEKEKDSKEKGWIEYVITGDEIMGDNLYLDFKWYGQTVRQFDNEVLLEKYEEGKRTEEIRVHKDEKYQAKKIPKKKRWKLAMWCEVAWVTVGDIGEIEYGLLKKWSKTDT